MPEGINNVLRRNLFHALDTGDLQQAALLLERLKQEDPLSVETRGMELDYLLRSRRLPEAKTVADQLVQLYPKSPRIHYLAGQVAYQQKEYQLAAERFRESYHIRDHWRSSLWLAKSLTQLGELDEAASLFESLLPEHAECYRDLAWLYERREQYDRALAAIESYLHDHPENEWAKAQRLRLKARTMDPSVLISETRDLLEFGEEPAESVVPQYLEALFRTGQMAEVRQFIAQRRSAFNPQLATGTGWICYRYQAYDLAVELFMSAFGTNRGNMKFLSALEFAASRSGGLTDLIRLYESHVAEDGRLFGRLHKLRRRATEVPDNRR
jgi:tetratricopeptide (TPR) repeat protein